jgi:hypothetical protein
MKMTKWFPGNVKPVHVGVYETASNDAGQWFQYWHGTHWGYSAHTPEFAYERRDLWSYHQSDSWRGLTEPAA